MYIGMHLTGHRFNYLHVPPTYCLVSCINEIGIYISKLPFLPITYHARIVYVNTGFAGYQPWCGCSLHRRDIMHGILCTGYYARDIMHGIFRYLTHTL